MIHFMECELYLNERESPSLLGLLGPTVPGYSLVPQIAREGGLADPERSLVF